MKHSLQISNMEAMNLFWKPEALWQLDATLQFVNWLL